MMRWLSALQEIFKKREPAPEPQPAPVVKKVDGPTLSQWVTYGAHRYRSSDEVIRVVFEDAPRGISRTIVDDEGNIRDFPGIEADALARLPGGKMEPWIQFHTVFERQPDGQILMIWEVQPDGRYWEDDGFGGTNDEEICLYTMIDADGRFTGPFRLYNVGAVQYYEPPRKENE